MHILFIVTSFWAYGELTIACEFAKRAVQAGFRPYFLIPPSHKAIMNKYGFSYTCLLPRSRKINQIIFQDIESRIQPELVILADFLNYNFCETHYGLLPEDLKIFHGRKGTFDDFDWSVTGEFMDTYGFCSSKFAKLDVKEYGFSLCPCPVVNPVHEKRENIFHYKLIADKIPYEPEKTDQWKKKLGLSTDKKLILFTSATWQESYKQYPDVLSFVALNNELFWFVLEELATEHTVICIGEKGYFSKKENSRIIFHEHLMPDIFQEYLLATDLFVARNLVSTSLARAVLSGIPAVNFENSVTFHSGAPLERKHILFNIEDWVYQKIKELKRSYPYRMYPVGWYQFLEPLNENNPYMDAFLHLEQYDIKGASEKIRTLLESENEREKYRSRSKAYDHRLDELPEVGVILRELIEGNKKITKGDFYE